MVKIKHAEKTFQQRQQETIKIMIKYPDRRCIYIEKADSCDNLQDINRHKYLVPINLSIAQFIYVVRSRIQLSKEKALFLYSKNNSLLSGNTSMLELYDKYKDPDGFFYITYKSENCFG